MRQLWILFKKDCLELFRTKKFLIITIVFVLFAASSPILAYITPELLSSLSPNADLDIPVATTIDSYVELVGSLSQIGMLTIAIALGGSIASERKKGLYNNLLNNGVKTRNFVLSKTLAQIIIVTVVYLISLIAFGIVNNIIFGEIIVDNYIVSLLALYIHLIFIVCLGNLFSCIAKSPALGIILTIVALIMLPILNLFNFGKYFPNYLVNIAAQVFTDTTIMDVAYTNFAISIGLSIIIIMAAIKLCRVKI